MIDLTGLGITALDFGARVTITDLGDDAQIVIDGAITLTLLGVNGDGANALDACDFVLAP